MGRHGARRARWSRSLMAEHVANAEFRELLLLRRCVGNPLLRAFGDFFLELLLREPRDPRGEMEHVVDRAIPPALPVSWIDDSGI